MHRFPVAVVFFIVLGGCVVGGDAPVVATPGADGGNDPFRYHPQGFVDPAAHGLELKLQAQDCRGCHGEDLTGDLAGTAPVPSCDSCHTPAVPKAWRRDCTFCHGGVDNLTGAPPRYLDGALDPLAGPFPEHTAHVASQISAGLDCVQCHAKPTDVLSPGHVFDDTAGSAENVFTAGLSPQGSYDSSGTCSNLYCHGNGRGDNGTVATGQGTLGCDGCHPSLDTPARWNTMSGEHADHLQEAGVSCGTCHAEVTGDGRAVTAPLLHIDRQRQVDIAAVGFIRDEATNSCTGVCHGEAHDNETW